MENREADDEKSLGLGSKFPKVRDVIAAVCDGTLNVKRYQYFFVVPNIFDTNNGTFSGSFFSETSLETFSGTIFFRYWFRDFFPVQNFSDTGSETFFLYHFFPIPVPIPLKKRNIPGTGNSRYRYVTLCSPSYSYQANKLSNTNFWLGGTWE